ncbi:MAG TPA: TIGR04283 family arsenosugar biosynthesis glycosyltransferase [Blastocatellia bacterium]|nr:TIGR04283 family arsenosugar biosynthesis glycosyltransferase [Blastocatellia bacterium]
MKISVIIPVLNERDNLPATLEALGKTAAGADEIAEIIIVDGGSSDGTREWLGQQSDLRVLDSERGRGVQLHTGAQAATGEALLFLHGDCLLPPGATQLIARALSDKSVAGGCFLIGFAERRPPSLGLIARGINARTIVTRTGTGDQAIFVRQEVYEAVGGFRPWPLFEDVDIVARIRRRGKFVVLRSAVTISARRWIAHGPWRTTFLMYALRVGYWLGIPPARLKQWFVDVRR